MESRLFLDTNVFLDLIFDRGGTGKSIKLFLLKSGAQKCQLVTSISCIQTIIYLLEKNKYSKASIKEFVVYVNELVTLANTTKSDIGKAVSSDLSDLEDAILYFTAISNECGVFITRNTKDYPASDKISILKPEEF
ncbi:MAG: PIN domain-containing protein [Bacteroidetes bacterium]|nr:PIN domain-containing protein [Bacteroidota bacterium]MDA1121455.1 PIN domain-containing protein [Bacteroidota bacterium]